MAPFSGVKPGRREGCAQDSCSFRCSGSLELLYTQGPEQVLVEQLGRFMPKWVLEASQKQ